MKVSNIDIIREKPIETKEKDRLNRSKFAANLAEKINNYTDDSSLTIGLIGKWGCGKTSIINIMQEEIDKNKIQIVEFNPWYFSGRKQLIADFFEILSEEISLNKNNNVIEKLAKDLKKYSKILKPMSIIPEFNIFIDKAQSVISNVTEVMEATVEDEKSNLSNIKKQINKGIAEYDKKILIIIDEIDRLESEEIKEIFQLVRALGDFDNIIYFLSFDREEVCKAFTEGERYLEKIINIPIYVPEISKKKINNIFMYEIENIFKGKIKIDKRHLEDIYEVLFKDNFYNLRELNRYINVIKFNMDYIVRDVNFVDYLTIIFLKLFEPNIYRYLRDNPKLLEKSEVNYQECAKGLISNKKIQVDKLFNILFENYYSETRRINDKLYFYTYFDDILSDEAFSSLEIERIKRIQKKEELSQYLDSIDKEKLMVFFEIIEEIILYLNKEQKLIFFEILLEKVKLLSKELELFNDNHQKKALKKLKIFRDYIELEEILNILASKLQIDDKYDIHSLLEFINDLIDDVNIKDYRNKLVDKIEKYINEKEYTEDYSILEEIGVDVEKYIKKLLNTDSGIIKYLKSVQTFVRDEPITHINKRGQYVIDKYESIYEIVIGDITNFIDYEYVKEKVDGLSEIYKAHNKKLLDLFYSPVLSERYELEAQLCEENANNPH